MERSRARATPRKTGKDSRLATSGLKKVTANMSGKFKLKFKFKKVLRLGRGEVWVGRFYKSGSHFHRKWPT